MDKNFATDLVKNTFEQGFDRDRFYRFIKELLNKFDESKAFRAHGYVKEKFKKTVGIVKTYERLGTYTDAEGNKIDILIVYLEKKNSLDRARTTLRNFVADYLKQRDMKEAALVAFVSPDFIDWRFSLVKMEYKISQTPSGNIKTKEEFTPAKRFSFLVGPEEHTHTAQSRLVPIIQDDANNPTLKELEDAFSVEKVTKEFFERYKKLFLDTKDALDTIVTKDAKIKRDFQENNIDTTDFAKKLLGQIIFLYFLQKKGWFGVKREQEWGSGPKAFLRELFEEKHGVYKNFFNDIVEPLFYNTLAVERPYDLSDKFNCRIPFLNGGLFDPLNSYDWYNTDIFLPNELFSNEEQTKEGDIGAGILDIFDRYNFTVKEDEPLEKEVAVDPEMLGKVFENLLEVKDRKSKGTYYTPREIVHYMCQESLINYLVNELSFVIPSEARNLRKDIETLIQYGETAVEHDSRVKQEGKETLTYSYKLPESIRKNAQLLDDKLKNIRVCDPAIGSGAFPVGMMNEIIRTRNTLTNYLEDKKDRSIYNFKRDAIQNSLYGVDIDPGAVEIAKLRLWLSLVVDEQDIKQIKPLPNLDYKIVCGNSLLSVNKQNLFVDYNLKQIEKLKEELFNETNIRKKQEYKEQIDKLIAEVTDNNKTFDFEIYFSEIFENENNGGKGFDVVIANPPYVRADSKDPNYKTFRRTLERSGRYKTLYEKWDLFIPFIERGLNLLNEKGDLNFIVSNAICTSKYAFKLLDLIQENYFVVSVDYFENIQVFDAGVIPVVLHVSKDPSNQPVKKIIRNGSFKNVLSEKEYRSEDFKKLSRLAFKKDYHEINIKVPTLNLGDICYMSVGMVLNADEKRAKGEFKIDDLISDVKTDVNIKPYIEAKNIDNYLIKKTRYLEWGTKRCPAKIRRKTFPELYERPKLMVGSLTGGIYDGTGLYTHHGIVNFVRFVDLKGVNNKSISGSIQKFNSLSRSDLEKKSENFDLKFLLAIINSKFANTYLNNIRRHRLENYFYPDDFRNLPIAEIPLSEQKPFVDLVDKIISLKKSTSEKNTQQALDYEKQIEQLVYKLYGLTPEEIAVVEDKEN